MPSQAAADEQDKDGSKHVQAAGDAEPGTVTETPAGDRLLRILAGFNLLVLAGVLALGVGQIVAAFQSAWWAVVPASVIAFLRRPSAADYARAARRASGRAHRCRGSSSPRWRC